MGYSTSNPPVLLTKAIAGKGVSEWTLTGTDATTTVDGSGYITNAKDLGMKKGDVVKYQKTDDSPITVNLMVVSAINADGSADLSNATALGGTNSD